MPRPGNAGIRNRARVVKECAREGRGAHRTGNLA